MARRATAAICNRQAERFDPTKRFTTPSAQQDIDDTLERAAERILQKPLPPLRPHIPTAPHDRTDEIMKDFTTHDHDREMSDSLRSAAERIMSKPLPELPEHKPVLPPQRTPLLDKINQEFHDILQRQNRPVPSPITPPGRFDPYQHGTMLDNRPMMPHPFGPPGARRAAHRTRCRRCGARGSPAGARAACEQGASATAQPSTRGRSLSD